MSNNSNSLTPLNRWSPLSCLPQQSLTTSGLLSLDHTDGEVELLSRSSIELRCLESNITNLVGLQKPAHLQNNSGVQWEDREENLMVTLTTHRLVFQFPNNKHTPHFLHLSNLTSFHESGGNWTANRSYKIDYNTHTYGSYHLIFRNGKSDRDSFIKQLQKSYDRRQWEESSLLARKQKNSTITDVTKHKVGIDAIITKNKMKHDHASKLAESAFGTNSKNKSKSDKKEEVDTLFREAGELVGIIQKYVATLERTETQNENGDADDKNEKDRKELTDMLQHMGMTTALSTSQTTSKTQYTELLARQLADFLLSTPKFKSSGGIMTLTDVYCLYNRARGTNMISPEELVEGLELMEGLGLGLRLREFGGSGVRVVQDCEFDDDVVVRRILDKIGEEEEKGGGGRRFVGVTSLEASRILKISALLANEQLLGAERKGILCRDVTLEGTRFFRNEFVSPSLSSAPAPESKSTMNMFGNLFSS